jgi:ribosome biogenesis GTPase
VTGSDRRGLIVARHRREVVVEDASGNHWQGLVRGRAIRPLTGDEVVFRLEPDGKVVVDAVLPRRTVLERIDSRGRPEGVAANVSLLAIVVTSEPAPDWQLVDRYLVAAAHMQIAAALVANKCDLGPAALDLPLETYAKLGYPICRTSVAQGHGLRELAKLLDRQRSVLLGQSGVGKSSLLNALLASEAQAVRALSRRRSLGRHTTSAAVLHRLPGGGEVIDSPGVRRYAPVLQEPAALPRGFVEFRPYLERCRFNDCRHAGDLGCAVQAAVERGEIDPRRYSSYLALRGVLERLT